MPKFKRIMLIVIFLILTIFSLNGCSSDKEDENGKIKDKVIQEIAFLDTNILNILHELNNISLENYEVSSKEITTNIQSTQGSGENSEKSSSGGSEGKLSQGTNSQESSETEKITVSEMKKDFVIMADLNNVNWDNVKSEIELLNSYWNVIVLDLYSLNVNNEEILSFSTALDKSIINIKNEDKKSSLLSLADMYSYIPKYLKTISAQNSMQNIKQTKAYIVNAYALVEQANWTEINSNIDSAIASFNNIISDVEYVKTNEYKVNKSYVLINDLKNSLSNQNAEMFYIKYKNVIQGLNIM